MKTSKQTTVWEKRGTLVKYLGTILIHPETEILILKTDYCEKQFKLSSISVTIEK